MFDSTVAIPSFQLPTYEKYLYDAEKGILLLCSSLKPSLRDIFRVDSREFELHRVSSKSPYAVRQFGGISFHLFYLSRTKLYELFISESLSSFRKGRNQLQVKVSLVAVNFSPMHAFSILGSKRCYGSCY